MTKMVLVTNGKETIEVSETVANDTKTLTEHGFYKVEDVKPVKATKKKDSEDVDVFEK